MSSQSMSVKSYLDIGGGKYEVRRFGLPEAMATNFTCMKEKVCGVYGISGQPINLSWKDNENDDITITSDEELMEAIADSVSCTNTNILRLYVTVGPSRPDLGPGSESGATHVNVLCDGCEGPVIGFRYKCMHCKDFDLCAACEHKGKHPEHRMIRIPTPGAKCGPKFWWREHGGPTGVNTDNGGNSFSQNAPGSASGGCWAEAPRFHGRHGGGRGRRGHGWGSGFGRPCGGAGFRYSCGGGAAKDEGNMAEDVVAQASQFANQLISNQVPNLMKVVFSALSGQDGAHAQGTPGSMPQPGTGASNQKSGDEAADKIAEEISAQASQFASQMATEHLANVMKGIFTPCSVQNRAQSQATAAGTEPHDDAGTNRTQSENNSVHHTKDCRDQRCYNFRRIQSNTIRFRVQARNDVCICLSPSADLERRPESNMYEVFIGGWQGTKSSIRRKTTVDVCAVETPRILSANEMRGFWITISDGGEIKVGREGECEPFMRYTDPEILLHVTHYGFCTAYGSEGNWSFFDDKDDDASDSEASIETIDEKGFDAEVSVNHNGIHQQCANAPVNSISNDTTAAISVGASTTSSSMTPSAPVAVTTKQTPPPTPVATTLGGAATTSAITPSAPVAVITTQTPPPTPVATATQSHFGTAIQTTQIQQANYAPTAIMPSSEETSHSSSQVPDPVKESAFTNIREIELETDHTSGGWTVVNGSPITGPSNAAIPQAMSSECGQGAKAKSPQAVNYPSLTEFQPPTPQPQHPNPVIQRAVEQMIAMGYNNEEGWLTQLLEAKQGDMNKVLDLLQPVKKT